MDCEYCGMPDAEYQTRDGGVYCDAKCAINAGEDVNEPTVVETEDLLDD